MVDSPKKRTRDSTDSSNDGSGSRNSPPPASRRRVAPRPQDAELLRYLPNSEMYERSYMHRDALDHVVVTATDFVITTSVDGHVKFWKKSSDKGIEFVKHFRAHMEAAVAVSASVDGKMFATASTDRQVKVFDVVNFDMIGIISVNCMPLALCWIRDPLDQSTCIAVSDSDSPSIYIYDPYAGPEPKRIVKGVHRKPVSLMAYNPVAECVVSVDTGGMVEYWTIEEPHTLPALVEFELKSQTNLYEFKKRKCTPNSLTFSPDFELFACTSTDDAIVRVFRFSTGKLYRTYDESIAAASKVQSEGGGDSRFKLDGMEFGRRMAVENEVLKSEAGRHMNAVFDESSRFIIYGSLLGIKIMDLATNQVAAVLGKSEPHRFVNMALIQGTHEPLASRVDLVAASNPGGGKRDSIGDPTLFCTAFKRNRFFMFTRGEPDYDSRDVFNERPTREEASLAIESAARNKQQKAAQSAVIRTTLGDIHMRLFPEYAPKAVENFATHAKDGYYNSVIFHRVIKRFMVQTGDPLGDGTGGESIWGSSFEDEFTPMLRHDKPFTVSMANSGPSTNGSQFFITTVEEAPWLDDKHTVFGRVTKGTDVVHQIEEAKTDKNDKPFDDISIMNIQINYD